MITLGELSPTVKIMLAFPQLNWTYEYRTFEIVNITNQQITFKNEDGEFFTKGLTYFIQTANALDGEILPQ